MFDDFDDFESDPIALIEFNKNRGAVAIESDRPVEHYTMTFSLVSEGIETEHSVDFDAFDDEHASNKANFLLRLGIDGTGYEFNNLVIARHQTIPNRGMCVCGPHSEDNNCPTHGSAARKTFFHDLLQKEV